MFGVSPAYFISRFGDRFTCEEIARSLPQLRADGFDGFQPEVYHLESLEAWRKGGAAMIARSASEAGLAATQFVAHFLLHAFESPEALACELGVEEAEKALEGLADLPQCRVFTLPVPAFAPHRPAHLTPAGYSALRSRLLEKLAIVLEAGQRTGRRLALESMPRGLFAGINGFLRLCEALGSEGLGYNFDTGHAWNSGEWVPMIPAVAGARILGTHLKDALPNSDAAPAPGTGAIPWELTLSALVASGYRRSWDIEFRCPAESAREEYGQALRFLRPLVAEAEAGRMPTG